MENTNKEKKQKIAFIIVATVIMLTLVISAVMHVRWISFLILGSMLLFCGIFSKSQSDKKASIMMIIVGAVIVIATVSTEIISAFTDITKRQMIHLYCGLTIMSLAVPLLIKIIQIIRLKKACSVKKEATCISFNMKMDKKKLYKQPIYQDEDKKRYTRDNFSSIFNPKEHSKVTVYVSADGRVFDVRYNLVMLSLYITSVIGLIFVGVKYIMVNF